MGYAIKLSAGTGKKYEVACGDLVRGHYPVNAEEGLYDGAKWTNNYNETSTLHGEEKEEYINQKITTLTKSTKIAKQGGSDGVQYANVITPSVLKCELIRRKKGKYYKAFDIVLGYYSKMNLNGEKLIYAYIDYTKAKKIPSTEEGYTKYPYIYFQNGRNSFSLAQAKSGSNIKYSAIDLSSYVPYCDTAIEARNAYKGQDLIYIDEVTSFIRHNKITDAYDIIAQNGFNGSMFTCKGFKNNIHMKSDIYDRPFSVLTQQNIFYSSWSTNTSNDRMVRLGFKIYTNGKEDNNFKGAPVIEIYNYVVNSVTCTNRPFLIFGIREQI